MTPLFSTAFFPPIAYIATLSQYAEAYIEAKETFPKQTYRNRMEIMTAGGVRFLTIPVKRNNHSRTEEVTIDYRDRWNVIHLRTLTAAYSASPYFQYYCDDIESLLMQHYTGLIELNRKTLEWTLRKLGINCLLTDTTDYLPATGATTDFRHTFSPKIPYPTNRFPGYYQVFSDRHPFVPNLSILDLIFNLGPEARDYINKLKQSV